MLLKTIDQIKVVADISVSSDFSDFASHLANAELSFLIPLLGSDMYSALLAYYNNPDTYKITSADQDIDLLFSNISESTGSSDGPSEHDQAWAVLLYLVQKSIVYLAVWKGFDFINAHIDGSGFHRSEDGTKKSLFKYQEDNLKAFLLETGINGLDQILDLIENHMVYFDAFQTQLYRLKSRIIPDTKTFSTHYFISNSRLIFERLRQHMKTAEELHLQKVLGQKNFNYIITELRKPAPALKVIEILPYLRDVVAWISTAMLMEESGAELTSRGLYLKGNKSINNSDLLVNTDEARVKELIRRNYKTADDYIDRLKKYLMSNSTDWDNYTSPNRSLHNRDNSGKRTFWT